MHENGFTTTILHSDRKQSVEHGAVHKPMHPSSEFAYDDARELAAVFQGKAGFTYARQGTPTTTALEAKISQMEAGKGSVTFATGMAALAAIFTTLLRRGDHLVSSQFVFGNTNSLFGTLQELGVEITFVDATDSSQVRAAIQPNTRMVFTETIANPGTQVADLAVIGEICREKGLVYVVDNTLTSPWMFRPASVGASLVMNSLSKYIGGHGNALGGAVTDTGLYDWSGYENIYEAYRKGAPTAWGLTQIKKKGLRDMGGTLAAEPAHRIAVGAETLALRMAKHSANALALARFLEGHPGVAKVHYPGLASHPQHARAAALFGSRFGGLLGVELADGVDCFDFLNHLRIVLMATHLGDTRSLALPAAHTIYYEMGAERRQQMGIADSLIRVSVGIEDEADLLFDFDQALNGCLKG
ncbi:cystathionine gamma-synthase family protein [Achromobacter denitrificans]|uniref:cystathionine gamma-synthase family protein n=1 Tax=Achromobacter denitrificans TaxID=32002 RepID=UPI000B4953D3|nr:cystathionine gamma-synthase family protein [Achromobacter denitrificans]MDF3944345.1 cystathionine gamma-synthase family protein [Achromobacter denitrificans]